MLAQEGERGGPQLTSNEKPATVSTSNYATTDYTRTDIHLNKTLAYAM